MESITIEVLGLGEWNWKMYNSLGQTVQHVEHITNSSLTVNRGNLVAGIYFYEVQTDNGVIKSGKLMVE